MGIKDLNRIYQLDDLARGDVMFAATGVTDGSMLHGVKRGIRSSGERWATTHSIIMRAKTGTVRLIEAEHNFGRKQEI
jgi:fructose-1,6-bisphosphatase II / sedoheptulose-1,7-bisphosphatase